MRVAPVELPLADSGRGWPRRIGVPVLLGILAVGIYHRTFATLWRVWMENDNYSHGILIPVVSGVLIWRRRRALQALEPEPSSLGLLVIAFAMLVQVAGVRGDAFILQGDSLILLLAGLVLHFGGWRWLRAVAFPIGYLLFMIPFLPVFETQVSFRLKQFAAAGAAEVSRALGIWVARDGMSLHLVSGALRIENACSGMQSLISLMALGAVLAHLARGTWPKRALLFLASVPIAVLVNVIRITALCVVATAAGVETATGLFHDVSGFVLFGFGFLLLLAVRRVLHC